MTTNDLALNKVMQDTADAIREKTGKSEKIAPVNFAEEIKSISAGGGESGGDEWQYYDVRNNTLPAGQWEIMMLILPTIVAMRTDDRDWVYIGSSGMFAMLEVETAKARLKNIGINMDIKQCSSMTGNQLMSFKELELAQGQSIASMLASFGCTPITKEQFYDLNA